MNSNETWPPPPQVHPPQIHTPQRQMKTQWFRPALWLGLAFNALACFPAVQLLQYPSGSEMMSDDLDVGPLFDNILPVAVLALLIGLPFAVWQIRRRRELGLSTFWESVGLLLCPATIFTGWCVLRLVVNVKAFDSLG